MGVAAAIRREALEETGVTVGHATHLFDVYMSPGSVTERVHFFAAPYTPGQRAPGGGVAGEGEDLELLELPLATALAMIASGEIVDAKTIMLLQWAQLHGLPADDLPKLSAVTTDPLGTIGAAVPDDQTDVADLMQRFLAAVSFIEGGRPEYDALHALFSPGGQLVKNTGAEPEISTVESFIAPRQRQVDDGELTAFEELEIAHRTELFGNVAHRFSTYTKSGVLGGRPFDAVGLISTQFIRTPDGWRISAMAWDDERPGLTVPDRYRRAAEA